MKDIPRVGFVCTGENALELSSAICCAGRLMRHFGENGYMTGGCYSCIGPSKQIKELRERIAHMCACNDVVVTVGCDGFREGDVIPDITSSLCQKDLPFFTHKLCGEEYTDASTGKMCKCFPSRAVAVICRNAILMNLSTDLTSALGKINSLLPSINFAVSSGGTKAPQSGGGFENLMAEYYTGGSFQN